MSCTTISSNTDLVISPRALPGALRDSFENESRKAEDAARGRSG